MSQVIKLKKGLDIRLQGEARRELTRLPLVHAYALKPDDFKGVIPKMLVRVDDVVKAGTPLFYDKYRPQVLFTSPVSGKVTAINRGDKRKILDVVIAPTAEQVYEPFRGSHRRVRRQGKRHFGAVEFRSVADDRSASLRNHRRSGTDAESRFRFRIRFGAAGSRYELRIGERAG